MGFLTTSVVFWFWKDCFVFDFCPSRVPKNFVGTGPTRGPATLIAHVEHDTSLIGLGFWNFDTSWVAIDKFYKKKLKITFTVQKSAKQCNYWRLPWRFGRFCGAKSIVSSHAFQFHGNFRQFFKHFKNVTVYRLFDSLPKLANLWLITYE